MHTALSPEEPSVTERGHASGVHPIDTRAPIYLFRVPTLVFEPYEAIGSLALALLRDPSRIARIRYVVEGDVGARRTDVLRAVLAKDEAARELFATDTVFVPVMLRGRAHDAALEADDAPSPLYATVVRSFAWAGLVPKAARADLEILRFATRLDDDERSLRGELCLLVARTRLASHLVFFDDGARELLSVAVPHFDDAVGEPIERALLDRVDAVLHRRRR